MNYSYQLFSSQPNISIPIGSLRIAPYAIEQLQELEIRQKVNEHSTLHLKGLLKSTNDEAELMTEGTGITLSAADTFGKEYVLFKGIVNGASIKIEGETRLIEINAVSYSYIFDIVRISRSFQDKKKPYTQLINQVAGAYGTADVTDTVTDGALTKKFIMQHKETDWEFLKRLASHFNTGLICDIRYDKPSVYFGIPDTETLQIDSACYTIKRDTHRFNQLSENGMQAIVEADFLCYEVETNCFATVGDEVNFRNRKLYVSEAVSIINSEHFVSILTLMPKKGLSQPYLPNTGVAGASYGGQILNIRNDQVMVALNADAGHDPGVPCWFPYSTVYSSKSGSGWYCMPEKGDSIRIYFPDGDDDHAYAISSVHGQVDDDAAEQRSSGGARSSGSAGGYSGKRDNPKVKSLTYGSKEVRLAPDGVYVITDNAMITLTEDGVLVMTENDMEFKSEKNITLSADEDVNIIGTTGVELTCETAAITIKDNVEATGQEVLAN